MKTSNDLTDFLLLFNSRNVWFTNNYFAFVNDHVSYLQIPFHNRPNIWKLFEQMRLLKRDLQMRTEKTFKPQLYDMNTAAGFILDLKKSKALKPKKGTFPSPLLHKRI